MRKDDFSCFALSSRSANSISCSLRTLLIIGTMTSILQQVLFSTLAFVLCVQAGCPFSSRAKRSSDDSDVEEAEIIELLRQRLNTSIYSKGLDLETRQRRDPTQKNLFGPCPSEKCVPYAKYRSFSGICNNLESSILYGRRAVRLTRLMGPDYGNHTSLPNPRLISSIVHSAPVTAVDTKHNLMLMQFGQFLDHDLTLTPVFRDPQGFQVDCTSCNADPKHCNPIPFPEDDTFFPARKCIEFTKSQTININGHKDQLNLVTAWIDGSHIYGSFHCKNDKNLRKHELGQMDFLQHPLSKSIFKPLLPRHATNHECTSKSGLCFSAGDDRSNEQPGLTVQHTLWLRHHNRIALQLSIINPHWDDEQLFQEARKIIIALNQHITFNEFLPRVLGENLMELYNLELEKDYFHRYDSTCQPDILNEFATAAFRFGHSLIPDKFKLTGTLASLVNGLKNQVQLRKVINNPDMVLSAMFPDELVTGMVEEPMSAYDRFIATEVRNHLMEEDELERSGIDLAAVNIQRGRDHGLRRFVEYESYCSEDILKRIAQSKSKPVYRKIQDFEDLQTRNFDSETIAKMKQVYQSVEDIDFFSGGLSEPPLPDGLVGKTFGCVIATQFERLRKCDRFWYENYQDHRRIGFTRQQLHAIKNYTLASLLCENLDVPEAMPRWAFDLSHLNLNPLVNCTDHYKLDLQLWKEEHEENERFCQLHGSILKAGEDKLVRACTKCHCSKEADDKSFCFTPKYRNCRQVIDEVGPEAVLADKACEPICGNNLSDLLKHLK